MKDIKNEFNKLSKQGKLNVHFYLISLMIIFIILLMGLTILTLEMDIINYENQIERLQERIIRIEQIQNNLIVHINGVGG